MCEELAIDVLEDPHDADEEIPGAHGTKQVLIRWLCVLLHTKEEYIHVRHTHRHTTDAYRRSGNFTRENIRLLNFHVVLFSSHWHTRSVASFLLFDVAKYLIFVVVGY